jgi:V/A-type H+-transporting ATPase subunit A
MTASDRLAGRLVAISGSVVRAETNVPVTLGEVARVGEEGLLGEVIALAGQMVTVQVYEETAGLAPGAPFSVTGAPLQVELGPGLLGSVFDGVQRPLERLAASQGDFLGRGQRAEALDRARLWDFEPRVIPGAVVTPGMVLGVVPETQALEHRILIPPHLTGRVQDIAAPGPRRVAEVVAHLVTPEGQPVALSLFHTWHVRLPRPCAERLPAAMPMITGQRVLDVFFPLPRGAAAGMPGGFGTGKTITQHQLCKWMEADVIVFVGCGERGNEITRVLRELPDLNDPRTGRPLAERTILIANTSNMPVAAREASIYTGVTIAEYYRDMGYHVALLADSTSRWAEALREISGRLEEMPAEEGYPPYLSSRLASFYERAGRATTLAGTEGSVSIISAISPPGGDLTEPVTRHSQRFTRCFWTLDKELAEARVFPAVSIRDSYSDVPEELERWWHQHVAPEWAVLRQQAMALLQEATRVEGMARLIGSESLPERQRFLLRMGSLFEEGFLRQGAFDPTDAYCAPLKQFRLLRLLVRFRDRGMRAIYRGVPAHQLANLPVVAMLERAKSSIGLDAIDRFDELEALIERQCDELESHLVIEPGEPPNPSP